MLTEEILAFIEKINGLNALDNRFYKIMSTNFSKRLPNETITPKDIDYILKCFKLRWEKSVDTSLDYMANLDEPNKNWIEFARRLGEAIKKNYLHILMPSITNTLDFNNLSQLTETTQFENFYLGDDGKVLYRKRGLCEHLLEKNLILSTCRDLKSKTLSALSITELMRLQASKQKKEFSIGAESFFNFWVFLEKKVFPRLQSQSTMPLFLLIRLLELIESYYKHKADRTLFSNFKEEFKRFTALLYQLKLEQVNYFYGIPIQYKDHKSLMLECLIEINQAHTYTLDDCFESLADALFQINPALVVPHHSLDQLYKARKLALGEHVAMTKSDSYLKKQCLNMLLSLFVTDFEKLPFSGGFISLWDIKSSVIFEATQIYALFESVLIENQEHNLVPLYKKALAKCVAPALSDSSMLTSWTRFSSSDGWLRRVRAQTLEQAEIIWYSPETIMHVLMRYQVNPELVPLIKDFIDQLIHTYTQDKNDLMKQFRANILFHTFIQDLPNREGRNLRLLLELHEPYKEVFKSQFLKNCIHFIVRELLVLHKNRTPETISFFEIIRQIDLKTLQASSSRSNLLKFFVDDTESNIYKGSSYFDKGELDRMAEYLRQLGSPVLTVKEREDLLNSVDNLGYLGAPT